MPDDKPVLEQNNDNPDPQPFHYSARHDQLKNPQEEDHHLLIVE